VPSIHAETTTPLGAALHDLGTVGGGIGVGGAVGGGDVGGDVGGAVAGGRVGGVVGGGNVGGTGAGVAANTSCAAAIVAPGFNSCEDSELPQAIKKRIASKDELQNLINVGSCFAIHKHEMRTFSSR
jgi:hypothetical protein